MVFKDLTPDQVAEEWARRITDRMRELKLPHTDIDENHRIVLSFAKTAVELLQQDPTAMIPNRPPIALVDDKAHLVIDLFLRGINQSNASMKKSGVKWEKRKIILEDIAWKIFNLSKLLVAMQLEPTPTFQDVLKQDRDLKLMLKHSAETLLQQSLAENS